MTEEEYDYMSDDFLNKCTEQVKFFKCKKSLFSGLLGNLIFHKKLHGFKIAGFPCVCFS